jgi:hypothetical protein
MKCTVLIAHYNKDISWVKKLKVPYVIYSAAEGIPNARHVRNKGMDASMYLSYIIDNYDKLPDKILFLHHHLTDWSQDFDSVFIANNLRWDCADYFNVGSRKTYWPTLPMPSKKTWLLDMIKRNWVIELPFPAVLISYAGTQFCVSRELIRRHPLEYYKRLHTWLMETTEPDWFTGRLFEWTWHYILTGNSVDKKLENNQFLCLS